MRTDIVLSLVSRQPRIPPEKEAEAAVSLTDLCWAGEHWVQTYVQSR